MSLLTSSLYLLMWVLHPGESIHKVRCVCIPYANSLMTGAWFVRSNLSRLHIGPMFSNNYITIKGGTSKSGLSIGKLSVNNFKRAPLLDVAGFAIPCRVVLQGTFANLLCVITDWSQSLPTLLSPIPR